MTVSSGLKNARLGQPTHSGLYQFNLSNKKQIISSAKLSPFCGYAYTKGTLPYQSAGMELP